MESQTRSRPAAPKAQPSHAPERAEPGYHLARVEAKATRHLDWGPCFATHELPVSLHRNPAARNIRFTQ
jgi:hypothetical protein